MTEQPPTTSALQLAPLLTQIADLAPVAAARAHVAAAATGSVTRVAPLLIAGRVPFVTLLAHDATLPLVYVLPHTESALRVVDGLRQWYTAAPVWYFPANETLNYEYDSTAGATVAQRLEVLQNLRQCQHATTPAQPIIVTTIRALLQPTLTPDELTHATLTLQVEETQPQHGFLQRCLSLGYRTVPQVEQPSDLARRGGIIDMWIPGDTQPLRVEWFGDEIDSLRRFDPGTQRSSERLNRIVVGPPQEVPFWAAPHALAAMQALDTSGLRPEAVTEWERFLTRLAAGDPADNWSYLAPFFRQVSSSNDGNATLLAHLPHGATVVFSDALPLAHAAHDMHTRAEERRQTMVASGELPTDFPRPYLLWDELLAPAAHWRLVDLTANDGDMGHAPFAATLPRQHITLHDKHGDALLLPADTYGGKLKRVVQDVVQRTRHTETVTIVSLQSARIDELITQQRIEDDTAGTPGTLTILHGALDAGWRVPSVRLTVLTDSEIFGWRQRRSLAERQRQRTRTTSERAAFLRGLQAGDYVVHIEHGIAVYEGLLRRTVADIEREYLSLRYASGDRLYVPVDQADRVARYVGAGDGTPQLTRLGTQEWERAKRKARTAVRDLADELIKIYAHRQANPGFAYPPDNDWQRELEDAFPYIETDDQLRALAAIKADMEQPHPMDRLMCGDVGFGKTEVALRAAFKAVQGGKQVAVLVPTTVLAQQHYNTFTERMSAFPVTIETLSRFRSNREQQDVLRRLADGQVDIVIGTHRLLSRDMRFKDLGLLIVDEEQRFGVRHKERLKQLRGEVDALTLTATPIPRTLHMSLAGIRDMSLIETPPEDRLPIKTYVVPHDENLIRDAIQRELDRGGQVYFVHNRVQSIYHIAAQLAKLAPEARIGVGHGQMDERELEKTMIEFVDGSYDILVATTIIENGLDVPNTNTIIIDDAPNYGLAQLYQLRGRVGRSATRAYAYLLYKADRSMTQEAQQRLEAIQEATELGAGFRLAMRDLEIRGAGNLLGAEQSGHIAAVGFDLYTRLLEQAIHQLRTGERAAPAPAAPTEPPATETPAVAGKGHKRTQSAVVNEKVLVSPLVTLDLPIDAYLPTDYVPDEAIRLAVYQQMVAAQAPDAVRALRRDLRDRFGDPPAPAEALLTWLSIKALALQAGVTAIVTTNDEFTIRLPIINAVQQGRLQQLTRSNKAVRVGPQFVRLDRRMLSKGDAWVTLLNDVLELLIQPAEASRTTRSQTRRVAG